MTLTVEIPALDRLCDILEDRQRGEIIAEMKDEIIRRLKDAAEGGAPRPKFEEVPPAEDHPWKDEAQAEKETPAAKEKAEEPAQAAERPAADRAEGPGAAKQDAPPVTLEALQKAAAQMRDEGRLKAVTELFPEFGIKRLSDLTGAALQQFGERLRKMGARV